MSVDPLLGVDIGIDEPVPTPTDADAPEGLTRNGHQPRRPPPRAADHDLEAEQIVLGAMMHGHARELFAIVSVDEFYRELHIQIASTIARLDSMDAPTDPVAVWGALTLTQRELLDGGAAYLHTLYSGVPSVALAPYHARTVAEHARRRQIRDAALHASQALSDGRETDQVLGELRNVLSALPESIQAQQSLQRISARELCAIEPPDDEQLLGPLLVRGQRLVIGAHTGQGKTTLSLQALAAVVHERDFLGYPGAGGRALIIDAEQGLRSIQRRLREAGVDASDQIDVIRAPEGLLLDGDEGQRRALESQIRDGGYDVVLADPLYKLHGGDPNDSREAVALMRYFDHLRDTYQFAFMLPVHCRKPPPIGARFTMHEFFGSGAYGWGAEVIIGIQMLRVGYSRLHWFKDRDGDLPIGQTWGLLFDRDSGYRRDPADQQKRQTSAERVVEILQGTPGRTVEDIAEETKLAIRTIKAALKASLCVAKTGAHGTKVWYPPAESDEQGDPGDPAIEDEEAMF